jgi:hypothetical protein
MDQAKVYFVVFVAGLVVGSLWQFWAAGRRRIRLEDDAVHNARRLFTRARERMPDLLQHMRAELARPELLRCRQVLVLPRADWLPEGPTPVLLLAEPQHPDLRDHFAFLVRTGLVRDYPDIGVLRFTLSEVFVALLWEMDA